MHIVRKTREVDEDGDVIDYTLEVGHYAPDLSWEMLRCYDDNNIGLEAATNLVNKLNGGNAHETEMLSNRLDTAIGRYFGSVA